ncbi:hypothetical protein [Labrys neptuniae]
MKSASIAVLLSGLALVAAPQSASAAQVDAAIRQWQALNSQYRGGSGDDPATQRACDQRDTLTRQLDKAGWCFGRKDDPDAAAYRWHRCTPASLRPD